MNAKQRDSNWMFENLSDVFAAAATKYLTAVDAEPSKSNQHEIGGLPRSGIGEVMGYPINGNKEYIPATMVFIKETEEYPILCEDIVTWYDSRYHDPKRGPEYRLYYKSNEVTETFREGDFFLLALTRERTLLMIFCRPGTQTELQLKSVFGAIDTSTVDELRSIPIEESRVQSPIRLMLARYGIELEIRGDDDDEILEKIRRKFGNAFPTTRKFSEFARKFCDDVSPVEDPDHTLIAWMNEEEHLFRLLERSIVREKLSEGFGENGDDVDDFVRFSLSVQNRRKSRVGHAFENHIEEVLKQNQVQFSRGQTTEGKQKPDFLFPGQIAYMDPDFPATKLRILAAKTTCKDRWRQVLPEADRIKHKHLITLEPTISNDQLEQIRDRDIQLVVPLPIQATYRDEQAQLLWSFKQFIDELRSIS